MLSVLYMSCRVDTVYPGPNDKYNPDLKGRIDKNEDNVGAKYLLPLSSETRDKLFGVDS